MSLYNMLFGQNPASDVYLAMLGLTRNSVGRFRDAYIERTENGRVQIVIHTRNGGGNRDCWHADTPKWGHEECKHHVEMEEAPVYAFMPKEEWPDGKAPGNVFTSRNGVFGCEYQTGERKMEARYVCEAPDSAECACPGCIIEHRLPRHPLYVSDSNDDFDSTYADIRFAAPEEYLAELEAIAEDKPFTPGEKWQALFAALNADKAS